MIYGWSRFWFVHPDRSSRFRFVHVYGVGSSLRICEWSRFRFEMTRME